MRVKIIKFLLPDMFYKTFVIKLVFLPSRIVFELFHVEFEFLNLNAMPFGKGLRQGFHTSDWVST